VGWDVQRPSRASGGGEQAPRVAAGPVVIIPDVATPAQARVSGRASSHLEQAILRGRLLPAMSFTQSVWALTARVPRGRVTTYRELAAALGTRAYRAVGKAMNCNPYAPRVPCHRVVGSDGRLVGYARGVASKRRMLQDEGISFRSGRVVLEECMHRF
jgi:methylated-DNA-[protein]-cysteine S-methyltransferase